MIFGYNKNMCMYTEIAKFWKQSFVKKVFEFYVQAMGPKVHL